MREWRDTSTDSLCPTIPLLPELEFSSLEAIGDFGMEGLRRAMITLSDDSGAEMDMDYDTGFDSTATDTSDICKLEHLEFPSDSSDLCHIPDSSFITGNDRHLHSDSDDVTLAPLTSVYVREYPSPLSESGESSFDHEGSDGGCSDSGVGSSETEVHWETYVDTHNVEGPLPPVADLLLRISKDHDFLPMLIKPEPMVDSDACSDSTDCSSPKYYQLYTYQQHRQNHHHHHHHLHTPFSTSTAFSSNHHDYTTSSSVDANNNETIIKVERDGHRRTACSKGPSAAGLSAGGAEKGIRKKPGRKKGQVSKVLHLWEFIRDLLSNPDYCPRIIHWENEEEGVFRVLQSSEVARLWGEKKKNKKTMTYEKLSRSLRYSRKEGYFDSLPKNQGYPKKLCFKFGPKSHGWREYVHN